MTLGNIIWLIGVLCAVWVIYDVWTKKNMEPPMKILWTVCALIFSVITAIVYYFVVYRK